MKDILFSLVALFVCGAFCLGIFTGYRAAYNKAYNAGQLIACKDAIVGFQNELKGFDAQLRPMTCSIQDGHAVVSIANAVGEVLHFNLKQQLIE